MEPFQVAEIISDVARARADLSGLAPDIPPERTTRCEQCVRDLEMAVSEVVSLPWVPSDVPQLTASIQSMNSNLHRVRGGIERSITDVIDGGHMDEYLRLFVAISMARLLEFQLEVLMQTLAQVMPKADRTN